MHQANGCARLLLRLVAHLASAHAAILHMATQRLMNLPSDPELLLELIDDIADESDDEFDGYLDPEDGPVAVRRGSIAFAQTSLSRARSLESLTESHQELESPVPHSSPSLSGSPMQVGELCSPAQPQFTQQEQQYTANGSTTLPLTVSKYYYAWNYLIDNI